MRVMDPKKPGRKKGPATRSTTWRLPVELADELAKIAEEEERAQTTVVIRALRAYLEKTGKGKEGAGGTGGAGAPKAESKEP
jgi:hypothetical protein